MSRAQRDGVQAKDVHASDETVGNEVNNAGGSVNHRRAQNAHHGIDVVVEGLELIGNGNAKLVLPKYRAVVGVDGVNAVVFRGNVNHVMHSLTLDGLPEHDQRLGIDPPVESDRLQQTEGGGSQ